VSIKVDREERPDVDAVYMDAVQALTGSGGWPLTVFLTPEREPFLGGTYFPPEPRHGLPSFRDVLRAVAEAYRDRRGSVVSQARTLVDALARAGERAPSREPLTSAILHDAARNLHSGFDPQWGGWGGAPKFPPASTLELLLRRDERELTEKTLDGMALGGMYDLVGGGFHRYSVDAAWLVPHFEKMLYDNALLASAYLHGWLVLGKPRYRELVEETLDYVLRELAVEGGGFASSQDADTDGVEGLTYTWTEEEGVPAELLQPFEHGRSVIRGELDPELRVRLFEARERRPKPARDDKVITSWNGLAIAALAEAGRRLDRRDYVEAAIAAAELLARDELERSYRDGRASGPGFLDDYANLAHGLYELHVATGDLRWLRESLRLARRAIELFADERRGGFFLTPAEGEQLVARPKDLEDHPLPAGNSMLAYVVLRLGRIYGDDELARRGVDALRLVADSLARVPHAFGWALCALDLHLSPSREVAIVGAPEAPVARAALAPFEPTTVVAFGPADDVPLLEGKTAQGAEAAVYVCERFACRAPVTDPAELAA
jgi:uncharacterized protein YyaL (SSP411 family)